MMAILSTLHDWLVFQAKLNLETNIVPYTSILQRIYLTQECQKYVGIRHDKNTTRAVAYENQQICKKKCPVPEANFGVTCPMEASTI